METILITLGFFSPFILGWLIRKWYQHSGPSTLKALGLVEVRDQWKLTRKLTPHEKRRIRRGCKKNNQAIREEKRNNEQLYRQYYPYWDDGQF